MGAKPIGNEPIFLPDADLEARVHNPWIPEEGEETSYPELWVKGTDLQTSYSASDFWPP